MIERFLKQEKAIHHVFNCRQKAQAPCAKHGKMLMAVSKALDPLLEVTYALSGELLITISYLKPVLSLFNTEVLAVKSDDTDLTKKIKQTIL